VIYADSGKDLQIVRNSYTGNTDNLHYFIDTVKGALVVGNTTNTTLPNKIGS
jgi:hypothetical protein